MQAVNGAQQPAYRPILNHKSSCIETASGFISRAMGTACTFSAVSSEDELDVESDQDIIQICNQFGCKYQYRSLALSGMLHLAAGPMGSQRVIQ